MACRKATEISLLRAFHVLERHYSPTGERHNPVRNGNTRRDVRVEERIVERASKENEVTASVVMPSPRCRPNSGVCEAVGRARVIVSPRTPWSVVRIVRVCLVININPGLGRLPAHIAYDLALGPAPGQPHSIFRHARADLALTHQCLIIRRKTLINFGILGDAVLRCLATCKNQRAGCEAQRQRGKNSTFHANDHMWRLSRVNSLQLC